MLQSGLKLISSGSFMEAKSIFEEVLKNQPNHFDALQLLGALMTQLQEYPQAIELLSAAIKINPNYPNPYSSLGTALRGLKRFDEALTSYDQAINIKPDYLEAHYNRANTLVDLGRLDEALFNYDQAILIEPAFADCHHNRANVFKELGRLDEALAGYDQTILIKQDHSDAHFNRANTLVNLDRLDEALTSYCQAILIKPDNVSAYNNFANILQKLGYLNEAIANFDKALSIKPDLLEAHYNRGNTLQALKRSEEALASYNQALSIKTDYVEALLNRGNTLQALKRFEEAIASYDQTIIHNPECAEAYSNRGNALRDIGRMDEALVSFKRALMLNPEYPFLKGGVQHAKMFICDWSNFFDHIELLSQKIATNEQVVLPFINLCLMDDPELHLKVSKTYEKKSFQKIRDLGPILKRSARSKIRLGYFSPDLYSHPVSIWLAEQLENHDKSQFELFAFSFNQVKDPMRDRLEKVFDHFIEIDQMSDPEVVQLTRELGIDIAFDLCVHTSGARPSIFAMRAAPIQVSHLGYPGTSGSECIDYIISDPFGIPENFKTLYTERIAYVPCPYTYDTERQINAELLSRVQFGLPENSFVFTCQNGHQKITPETFGIWMDILKAVPDSVLWLLEPNASAKNNLIKEAIVRGVQGHRLIFSKREFALPEQEKERIGRYLASYRLADLFLDTWPYNAGTTGVDALFAGLPILTKEGKSMVSRMVTSALHGIEMPELITSSVTEYQSLAIDLATNPQYLQALKEKLIRNKSQTLLFDAPTNTRYLEAAYRKMYERYQGDIEPDHIYITT
ncbi:tetratricopeptide repeat protein [Polynucleobacter sp. JS-JIR-5-A7]|uniref:tetratricopeptide repeat protein n=1 Tax=Polynucleobacter sp. JS-JIR-5-A7 TaxID=1758395 RepID=UPI0035300026